MYDLIIIGGGPAGITAGIYGARKKLNTLLISRDFIGQTAKAILVENYPGIKEIPGIKLMEKFKKHLEKFEIDINEGEEVVEIKKKGNFFEVRTNQDDRYLAKSIIVATGRDPRPLEVPGEKELIGRGISYCSICDAPLFREKTVAVIGGGNAGFEAALDLTKYAKKIYILEFSSKPLADEVTIERAKKTKKIEIILNAKVKEILGKAKVEGLIYDDLIKAEKKLEVEGVFIMIGQIPATSFVKGLVNFNEKDEIIIDPVTCQTKTLGLFAAGDVTNIKQKQIIVAAAEGAKAALAAYEYLQKL